MTRTFGSSAHHARVAHLRAHARAFSPNNLGGGGFKEEESLFRYMYEDAKAPGNGADPCGDLGSQQRQSLRV